MIKVYSRYLVASAPSASLITESVAELVALASAMAATNQEAFEKASARLDLLGVAREDRIKAVNIALLVKMTPFNQLMDLAQGSLAAGGCGDGCGCEDGCDEGSCGSEGGDCGCGH